MGPAVPLFDAYGNPRTRDEARIIKEMLDEEVEKFIQENRIDQAASRDLRNEPLEIAMAVLERGPLRTCTNPSGALIGRIRDAKRSGIKAHFLGGAPAPKDGGPPQPAAGTLATIEGEPKTDVDKFIIDNKLDQGAQISFRAESPDVQKAVMDQGPLFNCSNPSAALMGRIRGVKLGVTPNRGDAPPGGGSGVDAMVSGGGRNRDQGGAAASLAALLSSSSAPPPALAAPQPMLAAPQPVANDGGDQPPGGESIQDDKLNEAAMKAIAMLNMRPEAQPQGGAITPQDVERFIQESGLDDRAAQALRSEPLDIQTAVLERGSLTDSNNPSAALMGRIATAKMGSVFGGGGGGGGGAAPMARVDRASPQDVERFLQENRIDDRASRELQVESMEVQTAVLNRGPLTNCNNPSSALLGRIREAKRAVGGGMPGRPY